MPQLYQCKHQHTPTESPTCPYCFEPAQPYVEPKVDFVFDVQALAKKPEDKKKAE